MYKLKKTFSWFLIFVLLFTGINWSGITISADATEDLGLASVNMDIDHPYAIITLRVDSGEKTYNLYSSSSQIFYMSDYNRVVVKGNNSEVIKYDWSDVRKSWVSTGVIASSYNSELNVNDFLGEDIFVEQISNVVGNSLTDGFYVIAYGGINQGSNFKNHNYIDYKTLNRSNFKEKSINSLNLALNMINKENLPVLFGADTEGSLTPDFKILYPESSFVLPKDYSFTDNIGGLHTSDINWSVSMYHVDNEDIENVSIDDYITVNTSENIYTIKKDFTNDAIIEIKGTFKIGIDEKEKTFYAIINNKKGKQISEYSDAFKEQVDVLDNETLFISTNYFEGNEGTTLDAYSEQWTKYYLYSEMFNPFLTENTLGYNEIQWSLDGLSDISNVDRYLKITQGTNTERAYIEVNADEITKTRRDNKNDEFLNNIVIKAIKGENTETIMINLNIEEYLGGNFVPENANIDIAKIDFKTPVVGQYSALPETLKYIENGDYITLVNYSDYKLLFYTNTQPHLKNNSLILLDNSDIEIYKSTDKEWKYFNYVSGLKNGSIELPTEGIKTIDFINYDLYTDIGLKVLDRNEIDVNNNIKMKVIRVPVIPRKSGEKYYVLAKNNIDFYLIIDSDGLEISDSRIDYSEAEFYVLVQNKWVKANEAAVELNGFRDTNYSETFEKYLKYTNDAYFNNVSEAKESQVDYFRYLPNYNVTSGYSFIIFDTPSGYSSIEYIGGDLIIDEGNIVFENKKTNFDVQRFDYLGNVWSNSEIESEVESEPFKNNINEDTGVLELGGIVNSILYSNKSLFNRNDEIVFDTNFTTSVLTTGNFTSGDFLTKRPDPKTAQINDGVLGEGEKLSDYQYIYMEEVFEGDELSYYYTASKHPYYYDSQIYGMPNIYFDTEGNNEINLLKYKFNNVAREWEYFGSSVYRPVNDYQETNYIISYNDIVWHSVNFEDPERESEGYILVQEDVKFLGETNIEYNEASGFIDVSNLEDADTDYVYPTNDSFNYWIAFIDGLYKVINPFENVNKFGVVAEDNLVQLDLYIPLYTNSIIKILTGNLDSGDIVFDLNDNTLISKSQTDWFSPIPAAQDNKKPEITNIYIVNNIIKYLGEDLPEYQRAEENGEIYYIEYDGFVYKKIMEDEYYSNKPDIKELDGLYYTYTDENYSIDGDFVYYNGEKLIKGYKKETDDDGNEFYTDEEIYQMVEEDGIEVYKDFDGKIYRNIEEEEYNNLNNNFNNFYKIIDGSFYLLRDGHLIGEDGYVYNYEYRLIKEVIEDGQVKLAYASGVDSYIIEVNEDTVFGYEFSFTNEAGVLESYSASDIVRAGTRIPSITTSIRKPLNGANLTFYIKDKQGNISDGIDLNILKEDNNKNLYGEPTSIIENEINQAIQDSTTDTVGPEIMFIYIYNGVLNVAAKDVAQEGVKPVGLGDSSLYVISVKYTDFADDFKDNLLVQDIEYKNQDNVIKTIEKDKYTLEEIKTGGIDGHGIESQGIKLHLSRNYFSLIKDEIGILQDGRIEVSVFDKNNNETYASQEILINEDTDNTVVYGICNDPMILKMLENARKNKEENPIDAYPVIESVYTLNNVLYVSAYDDKGIDNFGYGFEWVYNSTIAEDTSGVILSGENEIPISFSEGEKVPGGTMVYKNISQQRINVPAVMNVYVRDTGGNITKKQITVTSSNEVAYGNVSDEIRDLINKANGESPEFAEGNNLPVFTAIYTYQGLLYVEGFDYEGLSVLPYGFNPMEDMVIESDFEGRDSLGNDVHIYAGRVIQPNTKIYKANNFQEVNIPMFFKVYLRDNIGQEVYKSLYIDKDNYLYYGDVPEDLIGEVEDPNEENPGGDEDPANPTDPDDGDPTDPGGGDDGDPTDPGGDDKDPTDPGGDDDKDPTDPGGDDDKDPTGPGGGDDKDPTDPGGDDDKDPTGPGGGDDKDPTDPGGGDDKDPTKPTPTPKPGDEDKDKDGKDKDDWDREDDEEKSKKDGPDKDNYVPGDNENSSGTIKPDDDFNNIDWEECDYVLEVLDKKTSRLIYRIQKDTPEVIELPRLEDSTEYIYVQSAVSEVNGFVAERIQDVFKVVDATAPVISKIWFSKNRIYVSAYDKGGLHEEAYNFVIENARNQNPNEFSSSNSKRVISGDIVIVTVRDAAGNKASAKVEINENTNLNSILYENLNPKEPIYVKSGDTKTVSYWLAYLKTKYGLNTENIVASSNNNSDNMIFEDSDRLSFEFEGNGILSFYDTDINKYITLNLRTSNVGKSYRTIVVEKGSQTDILMAFKQKLEEVFGSINGLTWATDEIYISREGPLVNADIIGVSKVVVAKNDVKVNLYVVVAEKITGVTSNVDFSKENFAYTYLVNKNFDLSKALNLANKESSQYIIIEDATDGIIRDGDIITLTKTGRKSINLIDVAKDVMTEIKFEVVAINPHISKFTDIIGSSARADIEHLTERGVIPQYPDNRFKPKNKMTTKEFLTMLNRVRLVYDKDFKVNKVKKDINLSSKDFDYYSSMNILINLSSENVKSILKEYTLNKAVTFEEVVALISETLLYNDYHNESGYTVPQGLNDISESALHLLSIGIISEDDARNGTRELTREEIAYILTKTIQYLEY